MYSSLSLPPTYTVISAATWKALLLQTCDHLLYPLFLGGWDGKNYAAGSRPTHINSYSSTYHHITLLFNQSNMHWNHTLNGHTAFRKEKLNAEWNPTVRSSQPRLDASHPSQPTGRYLVQDNAILQKQFPKVNSNSRKELMAFKIINIESRNAV